MKRLVILTVGKTHSGKTTFAKTLEQQLTNCVVIDQDNHADFINAHYMSLRPTHGPNTLKYAVTNTIVDYAVQKTDFHLILCNSNRDAKSRLKTLAYFREHGFESVLVHFDIPDDVLQERVSKSQRSKSIFRTAANFNEVLQRQTEESSKGIISDPVEGEANYLFVIKDSGEVQAVIQSIVALSMRGYEFGELQCDMSKRCRDEQANND
ncbi:ATP-binding protein [Paenibacillus thalictri]|uniref:ATP-binding protein n=1 Tax=Paenibacillus thalictri TaxID=2527873 RepID=A0A4Q9DTA4_9BACL|nr:ATP-binding protein [Paenibacillus thalictri]TBL78920.1 ATP-binding protein [Paenibacillus thalictri]